MKTLICYRPIFLFVTYDIALDGNGESANELKRIFACVKCEYDVLILDCPPDMTLLSENIIIVADMVVTPVIPTTLSILSFAQLVKLADKLGVNWKKLVAFFSMVDMAKKQALAIPSRNSVRKRCFWPVRFPILLTLKRWICTGSRRRLPCLLLPPPLLMSSCGRRCGGEEFSYENSLFDSKISESIWSPFLLTPCKAVRRRNCVPLTEL